MSLSLTFALYAIRPFGGLQGKFLGIARECLARGHRVRALTLECAGEVPEGCEIERIDVSRWWPNHRRSLALGRAVERWRREHPEDLLIGFNRLPALDLYYAADPCYLAKVTRMHGAWFRQTPRYRHYAAYENAVFDPDGKCAVMALTERGIAEYRRYYGTPRSRFHLLPPGIDPARRAGPDAALRRARTRQAFGVGAHTPLLLFVGSGFRVKGLDRLLGAVARLPAGPSGEEPRLLVAGEDRKAPFQRLARRLRIAQRVEFLGGRDDVTDLMLAADLLVHPARSESGGNVLIEALAAGLPVLCTDACGYAFHIQRAGAGRVLAADAVEELLPDVLADMLVSPERSRWREAGKSYAAREDLHGLVRVACDLIERLGASR